MTKNTSIVLIAVIAAVMMVGALAVTMTTGQAFARGVHGGGSGQDGNSQGENNNDQGGSSGANGQSHHDNFNNQQYQSS